MTIFCKKLFLIDGTILLGLNFREIKDLEMINNAVCMDMTQNVTFDAKSHILNACHKMFIDVKCHSLMFAARFHRLVIFEKIEK